MEEQKQETTQDDFGGCPDPLRPVLEGLKQTFTDTEFEFVFCRDEAIVTTPPSKLLDVLTYLNDTKELAFTYLVDVGGIHYPGAEHEFMVFYNLLSIETKRRIRVKTWCVGHRPTVPSTVKIWEAANWHEREAYDMYGILFDGHPDHRRIYLPEHVDIFPLRKDYPLRGDNDKPTW